LTQIQQNRYDQLLRRVADLKGTGSKVNDALTELFPVIDVENVPIELLLLSGTRLCMGRIQIAAGGATFFSQTLLANPAGSGVLATIIDVSVIPDTSVEIVMGPSQNNLTPGGQTAFLDTRVFGEGTVCQLQGVNNLLVTGSDFYRFNATAGGAFHGMPSPFAVLAPGGRFMVSAGSADVALTVSFLWKERVAQPSELNL